MGILKHCMVRSSRPNQAYWIIILLLCIGSVQSTEPGDTLCLDEDMEKTDHLMRKGQKDLERMGVLLPHCELDTSQLSYMASDNDYHYYKIKDEEVKKWCKLKKRSGGKEDKEENKKEKSCDENNTECSESPSAEDIATLAELERISLGVSDLRTLCKRKTPDNSEIDLRSNIHQTIPATVPSTTLNARHEFAGTPISTEEISISKEFALIIQGNENLRHAELKESEKLEESHQVDEEECECTDEDESNEEDIESNMEMGIRKKTDDMSADYYEEEQLMNNYEEESAEKTNQQEEKKKQNTLELR